MRILDLPSAALAPAFSEPNRVLLAAELDLAGSELEEALALLSHCGIDEVGTLPIGVIDRMLLRAHLELLGRPLEVAVPCPECGVVNALLLGPDDVPPYAARTSWCGPGAGVREPSGDELLGLPAEPLAALAELQSRCRVGPADGARPSDALDRAEQSLCGEVSVPCIECGASVSAFVDVQHLVMSALGELISDVDREVHLLASRYGWELATIEGLSQNRRTRLAALAAGIAE